MLPGEQASSGPDEVRVTRWNGSAWVSSFVSPGPSAAHPQLDGTGSRVIFGMSGSVYGAIRSGNTWSTPQDLIPGYTDGANRLRIADNGSTVAWIGVTPDPDYWSTANASRIMNAATCVSSNEKPGAVRALRVTGKPTAANRIVRWRKPAAGGTPTRYQLRVYYQRNNKLVHAAAVAPPRTFAKLSTAALVRKTLRARGDVRVRVLRYRVVVWATNADGAGPRSTARMTVRY